jgi:glycosyltransferase involved in cell wall biosynthesis
LTDALRTLLSNAAKREAMGERARRFVLAEADSHVCLKRLEAFYSAVAAGKVREGK